MNTGGGGGGGGGGELVAPGGEGGVLPLKPHAQAHLLSPTDKCKVCNEPAAKHVHYGAMTCFSCRAFFRRSIQNKTASTYVCRRAKNCEINLKTRKNCQFCRYSRCLTVGMKPTWVLSEEERQRRFRKNRDKQEQGGAQGGGKRSRGNSLNDLAGDFDLMEGGLTDTLPGLLLLEQAAEERARESVPVILEKHGHSAGHQPGVVVKNEMGGNGQDGPEQQALNNYFSLPLGEPNKTSSFFVKSEPKQNYGCYLPPPDQKPVNCRPVGGHGPVQNTHIRAQNTHIRAQNTHSRAQNTHSRAQNTHNNSVVFVTSASHFPQVPPSPFLAPRPAAPMRLAPLRPAFLSSTPSVIVQAANSGLAARSFGGYRPSLDYPPESSFPMEVRGLATVEAELVSPGPSYSHAHQVDFSHTLAPEEYESRLEDGLEYVDSVYSDSSDEDEVDESKRREAAAMQEKMLREPEIKFSKEEDQQLARLVKQHDERYRSVNFGEELIKEMIMCSMFGIPVSTSAAISGYRLSVERITRIAHNLESFTSLPKCDQNALLKENADLLVSLRGAIFFDSKKRGVDQVLISMGKDDMETLKTMFTPLLKENSMKHIDYKTFNSIQAIANPLTEERYNMLQVKVADSMNDEICIILVTYIILFSTDFCNLSNRGAVEKTQESFTRMLQRYIYSRNPRPTACSILSSTLGALMHVREMADIKKSRSINQNVKIQ